MTQQEYEQKKRECWEEFRTHVVCGTDNPKGWFERAFDRAYALGKQEKDAEGTKADGTMKARRKSDGEIIEVEAAVYNLKNGKPYHKCLSDGHHYPASDLDFNLDAEDTVIQGWVCRDKMINEPFTSDLFLAFDEPTRIEEWGKWGDMGDYVELDSSLFPDLTWESDPIEVELILKRKKK